MIRRVLLASLAWLAAASLAGAQDTSDPGMIPVPLYTSQNAPQGVDPLRQFAADVNARFIYGAQSRKTISDSVAALAGRMLTVEGRATALEAKPDLTPRVVALEARPIVPDLTGRVSALEAKPAVPDLTARVTTLEARPILTDRVTALEARPIVPDLTTRVVALEARPIVPDLTSRVTTLEARPNYTMATLTAAGVIKANVTQIARTTTPISISLSGISVLGLTALVTTATVTVPGVQLGDAVQATFASTPPTGLIPTAAQVTAANTVVVTFAATQAVTLAAGAQSLNFVWTR